MCDIPVRDQRTLKPVSGNADVPQRQEIPVSGRFRRIPALERHMSDVGLTTGPVADRELARWRSAHPD